MAKLTKEQRIEMYTRYKAGEAISQLAHVYKINSSNVRYLVKLINHHGIEILDNKSNTYYDPNIKKQIINKVLIEGKTIYQTAIEHGLLSRGMLSNWIRQYKLEGYVIVEKTKGRRTTMKKPTKKYEQMTESEKIKYLENKNLYLELEVEYLKKLEAVIQKRSQQPLKK
ncbi:MAG: transposase [Culicoidibacterales bacterium]